VGGRGYQFTVYIMNTIPPPTAGSILTLDIAWAP
jgi:hypothetical protein